MVCVAIASGLSDQVNEWIKMSTPIPRNSLLWQLEERTNIGVGRDELWCEAEVEVDDDEEKKVEGSCRLVIFST